MVRIKKYSEVYISARKELKEAGVSSYDLEARLIVSHAAGKTREEFLRDGGLFIADEEFEPRVAEMLKRRVSGEPVAYILGEWEFYGLPIQVNRDVLIPRIDTEVLAGAAIEILNSSPEPARVLDLCAGSGCVGLAIAANTEKRVVLADISQGALKMCRANAAKNGLSRSVMCIEADVFEPPAKHLGVFDVIVCNPPYIPTEDMKSLDISVTHYEPAAALDGGDDGLRFYRAVASEWKQALCDGGILAFECGIGQARDVAAIMSDNSFENIKILKDTLDIERVIIGRVKSGG